MAISSARPLAQWSIASVASLSNFSTLAVVVSIALPAPTRVLWPFTDGAEDPYDISQGFWYAHMGWILFKLDPEPPLDNVADLRKDPLVRFQADYYVPLAILIGFLIPAFLGWLHAGWVGALGGLLIAGVARVTVVQHMTFFINSLCHT